MHAYSASCAAKNPTRHKPYPFKPSTSHIVEVHFHPADSSLKTPAVKAQSHSARCLRRLHAWQRSRVKQQSPWAK